jgi:hypothetical protein
MQHRQAIGTASMRRSFPLRNRVQTVFPGLYVRLWRPEGFAKKARP